MKYAEEPLKGVRIECCAILYKGVCYIISSPATHKDVADYIEHWLHEEYQEDHGELGFMTDKNEFLTLTEGLIFATDKGHIENDTIKYGN